MITTKEPQSWRELQEEAARILRECGFSVEVERVIPNARGNVEIDVYAEETVDGRRYVILCECKHWRSKIPQNVIHGFRTVMADVGANLGLVIASEGFQSGANEAVTFTNVKLVTWQEFQTEFEQTWLRRYLYPTVAERCDPLLTYAEPLAPAWWSELSEEDQQKYLKLKERHDVFGLLMMTFTPYLRMLWDQPAPPLPLRPRIEPTLQERQYIPDEILDALAYREFLEAAFRHSDEVIAQFRRLRPNDGA
jgi:restriction system protein